MKQIIDGKVYNTETAELIGEWYTGGIGQGDFNYMAEDLYKTKSGAYFLAGEGGAMTRYSRSAGNNTTTGGSAIIPLTAEEALRWAERRLDADTIEKEFTGMLQQA